MAKNSRGRPRHAGDRADSGRLSRSADAMENRVSVEQRAQRMAQRFMVLGEAGQSVDTTDPIAVLEALGHISAEEASAGARISQLHRALFERARVKSTLGGSSHGSEPDEDTLRGWRATYERALSVVGSVGGTAVGIVRLVACARDLPAWVSRRPLVTISRAKPKEGRAGGKLTAVSNLDRAALRLMSRELPALQRALSACADAGIVSAKKGRR